MSDSRLTAFRGEGMAGSAPTPTTTFSREQRRQPMRVLGRTLALLLVLLVTSFCAGDDRPSALEISAAGHQLSVLKWELANLPKKWLHRATQIPWSRGDAAVGTQTWHEVEEFLAAAVRVRWIDRRLVYLSPSTEIAPPEPSGQDVRELAAERDALVARMETLRPMVEETLETAVAGALRSRGFWSRVGVFPPVDAVLTNPPTVLVTSPRDRIARGDELLLNNGLSAQRREAIEDQVETLTDLSALVVDTGGIAFYPSIVVPHAGLDYVLEITAHEWVHQWLWFRPLGRRYFSGGDLQTLNETVATIAGRELGELARQNLPPPAPAAETQASASAAGSTTATSDPSRFDFQGEMRTTRIRVNQLLAAGDVTAAEQYMEQRRRLFVENGYAIRRLNQAYFAFHGSYATTGAAGVNIIGEQVEELRRRSPSLAQFLRTAAQFDSLQDLDDYLDEPPP